jgi:adenylylsulfate kinase-like enzyme
LQGEIIHGVVKVGRRTYTGISGWETYIREIPTIIDARFKGFLNEEDSLSLDSFDAAKESDATAKLILPLAPYGIPPVDEKMSICSSDVITVIGNEGVGKTNFAIVVAVSFILQGLDVVFMAGESSLEKIKCMLYSRFIYVTKKRQYTWQEIQGRVKLLGEKEQRIIEASIKMFTDSTEYGKVRIRKRFSYENFYDEAMAEAEKQKNHGITIVDHMGELENLGIRTTDGFLDTDQKRYKYLMTAEEKLSDKLGSAVMNFIHTSSDAYKELERGRSVGVRSGGGGSANTKGADIVIILFETLILKQRGMVAASMQKVRDYQPFKDPIVLRKRFQACSFDYRVEDQYLVRGEEESISVDEALF